MHKSPFNVRWNSSLQPIIKKIVMVYIDDILVFSKTLEDHIKQLEQVFTLFRQNAGKKPNFRNVVLQNRKLNTSDISSERMGFKTILQNFKRCETPNYPLH